MATIFKRSRWVNANTGRRCSKTAANAKRVTSRFYTIQIRLGGGKFYRVKGSTDRQASEQLAARLEREKARGEVGLGDRFKQHRARPLSQHFVDYLAELRTRDCDDKYVYNIGRRLTRLAKDCRWKFLTDINADSFTAWRQKPIEFKSAMSKDRKIGPSTLNQYLQAIRGFCNWCVEMGRAPDNPLVSVKEIDVPQDQERRKRRAATMEEMVGLLAIVPEKYALAYRVWLTTGLRREELTDLQWGDTRLNAPLPFLKFRASATKSRRSDEPPLRQDIAQELRARRGDAEDDEKVFLHVPSMKRHKSFLRAAGIEYKDAQGRQLDVHALRHTFCTHLSMAGVSAREAMELMRNSEMKLTMRTYTDPKLFNLAAAVEKLPGIDLPKQEQQRATGTDGRRADAQNSAGRNQRSTREKSGTVQPTGAIGQAAAPQNIATHSEKSAIGTQLSPIGQHLREVRHVGLEPTTR